MDEVEYKFVPTSDSDLTSVWFVHFELPGEHTLALEINDEIIFGHGDAVKLTESERCVIWLPDGNDGLMRAYTQNDEGVLELYRNNISVTGTFLEKVMREGVPFHRSELTGGQLPLLDDYYVRAVLCVPLQLRGQALGVLSVVNETAVRHFNKRHAFLLSFLGDYTAIAIDNARILRVNESALTAKVEDLNALIETTRILTSSVNLEEVARLTIQQVHARWDIEASSLWLVNEQEQCLTILASVGTAAKQLADIRVPLGMGYVGYVIKMGEPILSNTVTSDDRHYAQIDHTTGFQTRSIVCVPLVTKGKVTGAVQLINNRKGDFSEYDVEWATSMAAAVAIAITNARAVYAYSKV